MPSKDPTRRQAETEPRVERDEDDGRGDRPGHGVERELEGHLEPERAALPREPGAEPRLLLAE